MRVALAIVIIVGAWRPAPASADGALPAFATGFLQKHCVACHGPKEQKSNLRFDRLDRFNAKDSHLWTKVHEALTHREMPPEKKPQPSDAEQKQLLAWIALQQRKLVAGATRRLNRREFGAALQQLTGRDIDYTRAMPEDGKVGGFDTGAEGLQDAAATVATAMEVTRRAVESIRFLEPEHGPKWASDVSDVKDARRTLDDWKKQGAYFKVRGDNHRGMGLLIRPSWLGDRDMTYVAVPPPPGGRGVLRMKLTVAVAKFVEGLPDLHLQILAGGETIDIRPLTATPDKPIELVYDIQLDGLPTEKRGIAVGYRGLVEVPYAIKGYPNEEKAKPEEKIPGGTGLWRPKYDRKKVPYDKAPIPYLLLKRIEVTPYSKTQWPPVDWDVNLGELDDNLDSAKRLLKLWIDTAWRRPSTTAERRRFVELYQKVRGQGATFDNALRVAFQSVLLSAPFRYLPSPAHEDKQIGSYALASRLSYILHGSPPDKELLGLAASGKLRDPKVLDAQVDRLIEDPQSEAFFKPFVWQWLEMGQPITLAMDHIKKQDFRFGRHLKASMQDETVQYVARLFRDNRPMKELIHSDWTMMNDILARHYGYDTKRDITGSSLRKVKLDRTDPRGGGVLGHAGIQSMLCWMGDNWVIYRGAWTLKHILDDAPPPPPLEVPELDPTAGENRGKPFRELLIQHQKDPRCNVCHKTMDPMGFAFQNFDISGRWRDVEHEKYVRNELDGKVEWRGAGKSRPVDAVGKLPRGEAFQTFDQAKALIIEHYLGDVSRGVLKNLTIYATGRKANVHDMEAIRGILVDLTKRGYPARDLLKAFIRSRVFVDE